MTQEYISSGWHWIKSKEITDTSTIEGKYLFYCETKNPLIEVAKIEIEQHNFPLAKVILPKYKILDDFVLCLYSDKESQDKKMIQHFKGYLESHNVRFWKWKSEEETKRGEYEEEYLEKLREKRLKYIEELLQFNIKTI